MFEVTEVSIAELRAALESGQTTAVELVQAYLARIDAYDGPDTTTALNAVVVRNPAALQEAQASDARRTRGETLGPLDGIPYTAKDSYLVKGLTAASGSPAFKNLIAHRDAFTIERLRAAGAGVGAFFTPTGFGTELAKNTDGVRSVDNKLMVSNKTSSGKSYAKNNAEKGTVIADSWITTKVKSTFMYSSNVAGSDISVNTDKGVVTLSGEVGSGAEQALAIELAQNIRGVKSVTSRQLIF